MQMKDEKKIELSFFCQFKDKIYRQIFLYVSVTGQGGCVEFQRFLKRHYRRGVEKFGICAIVIRYTGDSEDPGN